MRPSRTTSPPALLGAVIALVALLLTAGCGADAAASGRGGEDEPGAVRGDLSLVDDDGTVGPIVALGDSLTADIREEDVVEGTPYESWYEHALEAESRLENAYNAGIAGNTTRDMLARFSRDVAAHDPRVVVILGGTNDLAAGRSPEQVLATVEQLAELARAGGAMPVLGTIPPRTDGPYAARVEDLNAAITASGKASGTTVIDFFSVLADDDGGWRTGFTVDGVHPTRAAADAMAETAVGTLLLD